MTKIDYEMEYNNRARVPEHPEISAGWRRDSEAYRTQMTEAGRAELNLSYGATARQFVDLFFSEDAEAAPVALFIHGGYWRALDPTVFSHFARGLNQRGVDVALVGYDLCPQVEIKDIIAQVRKACLYLWERFNSRITVFGHSAGGHLSATTLATDWHAIDPTLPVDLVPAAYAISGLFDLAPFVEITLNQDLRLTPEEARGASPNSWPVPAGRIFDAVVGGAESSEYLRQSRDIVEAWRRVGAEARFGEIANANHFTVVAPLSDPKSAMTERLVTLCAKANRTTSLDS